MKKRNPLLYACDFVDKLVKLCWWGSAVLLGLLIAALAVQIFLRSLFKAPIYGIEEAVTAMMIWFATLGAVVVTKENGHAQVEFFVNLLPPPLRKPVNALAYLLGGIMGILLSEGGLRLYAVQAKAVPQGGLPFGRVYYYALPMIVLGILLALVCVAQIIRIFLENKGSREGGDII